jgi:hypothetical protein
MSHRKDMHGEEAWEPCTGDRLLLQERLKNREPGAYSYGIWMSFS